MCSNNTENRDRFKEKNVLRRNMDGPIGVFLFVCFWICPESENCFILDISITKILV